MTTEELKARIQKGAKKLAESGKRHHAMGDLAAKVAMAAPDRRAQRNAQNVNRTTRAVGEGISASLWLLSVVDKEKARRGVPMELVLPALDRVLADALVLADDLEFEARIAMSYLPEPAKRPTRRRT